MGNTTSNQSIRDILSSVKVTEDDLLNDFGTIIQIDSTTPLASAYKTLCDHHILSAPVWDEKQQAFIGFLDLRDFVSFATSGYEEAKHEQFTEKRKQEELKEALIWNALMPAGRMANLLKESEDVAEQKAGSEHGEMMNSLGDFFSKIKIRQQKVKDYVAKNGKKAAPTTNPDKLLLRLCKRNSFRSVSSKASLLDVCMILATGAHSVPVMDDSKHISNIITQSSVIRYIRKHKTEEINKVLAQEIGELGESPIITVPSTATVYQTLKKMDEKYISGVGIVDADSNLVGSFSGADLRGWFQRGMSTDLLNENVVDFLKARQALYAEAKETDDIFIKRAKKHLPKARPPIITSTPVNTLASLVTQMDEFRVHRVYIVDTLSKKPKAVVCLKDLIRQLIQSVGSEKGTGATAHTVCDCFHCKGRYAFANKLTVEEHLYKYGKHASK